MKKLIWIISAISSAAPFAASAQQQGFIELLRSDVRADKVAILTESMELTESQAESFWPIYREYEYEYELELSKLGDRRLAMLRSYAESYESLSNETAGEIAEDWFKLQEDHTKLKKKYFQRVEKALSATVAARFIQVEHQIQLLVELGLASEVPLVKPVAR